MQFTLKDCLWFYAIVLKHDNLLGHYSYFLSHDIQVTYQVTKERAEGVALADLEKARQRKTTN